MKVKAHRSLAQVPDCLIELHRFKVNAKVDEYAKLGAETNPVDQEEADEYKDVKKVAKHVVSTLALRPPGHIDIKKTSKKCVRRARLGSTHSKAHDFVWCQKTWVCVKCLVRSRCPILVNSFSPSCPGLSVMSSIFNPVLKHRIWVSRIQGGGEVFYCSICWCHAECFRRGLKYVCKGPPDNQFKAKGFGRISRSRIKASMHPNGKHRLHPPVRVV